MGYFLPKNSNKNMISEKFLSTFSLGTLKSCRVSGGRVSSCRVSGGIFDKKNGNSPGIYDLCRVSGGRVSRGRLYS